MSAVILFFLVFCFGVLSGVLFPTYSCNVNLAFQLNYSDVSIDLYVVLRNRERNYLPVTQFPPKAVSWKRQYHNPAIDTSVKMQNSSITRVPHVALWQPHISVLHPPLNS